MNEGFHLVVVEGELEVSVAQRLCQALGIPCPPPVCKGGGNAFWRDAERYNQAAKAGCRILGLVDQEQEPCVPGLLARHLPRGKEPVFVLRVAQRMIEAWLLADREGMADFLHISRDLIPLMPDKEIHPKQTLVTLARKSKKAAISRALVPEKGLSAKVGKEYLPVMKCFVEKHWDIQRASHHSPSLKRALTALEQLYS